MSAKKSMDEREARMAELKKALNVIDEGSVINLEDAPVTAVETLSTGIIGVDALLGGGVPYGRIVEVFGNEGSGKTTLCSHIVASAQANGAVATYLDVENSYDMFYAKALGVDSKSMVFDQPSNAEKTFDLAIKAAELGRPGDLVIIDSMAALVPQAELEGDMSDQQMAAQARVIGKGLRKLLDLVSKNKIILLCVNQLRDKMNVMWGGERETTPGGRALKFYATQRIQLVACGKIKIGEKEEKEVLGQEVLVKVIKNKIFTPFKEMKIPLYFGKGFSALESLLHLAIARNLIQKDGAFYTLFSYDEQSNPIVGTENQMRGIEAVKEYFSTKPDELEKLTTVVKARMYV
jgi:recombination protein RecA